MIEFKAICVESFNLAVTSELERAIVCMWNLVEFETMRFEAVDAAELSKWIDSNPFPQMSARARNSNRDLNSTNSPAVATTVCDGN